MASSRFSLPFNEAELSLMIMLATRTNNPKAIVTKILHGCKGIIPSPSKAPGHAKRDERVKVVLDKIETALLHLAARCGIKEGAVTACLSAVKPHAHTLTVAVGDINEQHPYFFPLLALSLVAMLVPESLILGLLGFGPAGPVAGSMAASMQSVFWGGAVASGSWFASLQAAGMGVIPAWVGVVTKGPLVIGSLTGALLALSPASATSN